MGCGGQTLTINVLLILCILGLSTLGSIAFYLGNLLRHNQLLVMSQYDDYPYYIGLSVILTMGLFFLLTLLLMLTKHKCVSLFYGFFLIIFTVVALAVGGVFMWAKFYVPDMINNECANPDSQIHYVDTAYYYAN